MCAMSHAFAQHIDDPALGYLPLHPREESAPGRAVLAQRQGFRHLGLGRLHEGGQLDQIDTILAVVVEIAATRPANAAVAGWRFANGIGLRRLARMARERDADMAFETRFGSVGAHAVRLGTIRSGLPSVLPVLLPR